MNIANCLSAALAAGWEEILRNGYFTHMHIAVLLLFYFCIHPPFSNSSSIFFFLPPKYTFVVVIHCTVFPTFYLSQCVWKLLKNLSLAKYFLGCHFGWFPNTVHFPLKNVSIQYTVVEWKGCSGRNRTFFHPFSIHCLLLYMCAFSYVSELFLFLGQKSRKVGHVLFMHLGFLSFARAEFSRPIYYWFRSIAKENRC